MPLDPEYLSKSSVQGSLHSLHSLVELLEHLGDRLLGTLPQAGGSAGKAHKPNSVYEKLEALQVLNSTLLRRGHDAASRIDAGIRAITDLL